MCLDRGWSSNQHLPVLLFYPSSWALASDGEPEFGKCPWAADWQPGLRARGCGAHLPSKEGWDIWRIWQSPNECMQRWVLVPFSIGLCSGSPIQSGALKVLFLQVLVCCHQRHRPVVSCRTAEGGLKPSWTVHWVHNGGLTMVKWWWQWTGGGTEWAGSSSSLRGDLGAGILVTFSQPVCPKASWIDSS